MIEYVGSPSQIQVVFAFDAESLLYLYVYVDPDCLYSILYAQATQKFCKTNKAVIKSFDIVKFRGIKEFSQFWVYQESKLGTCIPYGCQFSFFTYTVLSGFNTHPRIPCWFIFHLILRQNNIRIYIALHR